MDEAHNKLLERLRTYYGDDLACRTLLMDARHALEALAGEVVDLKKRLDIAQRWPTFSSAREAAEAAEAERDRLKAALQPFARFAKMFAEAREHRQGHVPVEPNAEWYARETKQGTYILTPGMFDEALSALGDAS